MGIPTGAVGGIYAIRNLLDQKLYVGSAASLEQRKNQHFQQLRGKRHFNRHLQAAWIRDGEENFVFDVLEIVADRVNLIAREQHYIDTLQVCDDRCGYNLRRKADSNLGIKFSAETVQKNRAAQTGKRHSDEAKDRISAAMKGRAKSSEHAANIAAAKRGIERPAEMVARIAKKLKRFGDEQVAEMRQMRVAGATYQAIADAYQCSIETAHRIINRTALAYQ